MSKSENISPTAYATGHMWYRHGLSHPGLVTTKGRILDKGFGVLVGAAQRFSGVSFDALMLARHKGIDGQLSAAIDSGRVTQVVELAAGLSPRAWRFCERYGKSIRYIETDLPHMVAEKKRLLKKAALEQPGHEVKVLDVLRESGPGSLADLAASLDPKAGLAIITEGLMNYLSPAQAQAVWQRIAHTLAGFSTGQYLADFYLTGENKGLAMQAFGAVLQSFVRGRLHIHFESAQQAVNDMKAWGFDTVQVHKTADLESVRDLAAQAGAERVRVLEAWV